MSIEVSPVVYVNVNVMFFVDSLKAMRAKVWTARTESPLFDCKQYAQGMEMLYSRMWDRHSQGLKPDHIAAVSDK